MQAVQTNPTDAARAQRWLTAGFAGETRLITDPSTEIPQLLRLAAASQRLRDAQRALAEIQANWKAFSARHEGDDQGHAEFHRNAEQALRLVKDLDLDVANLLSQLNRSLDLTRVEIRS